MYALEPSAPSSRPIFDRGITSQRGRHHLAIALGRTASRISRVLGIGGGSMVGGQVAMLVDPHMLENLGSSRRTVLVTGSNGKSTTSRLLAAALADLGPIATGDGANRTAGLVSTMIATPQSVLAALETREVEACEVIDALRPTALVLLNLSNDVDRDTDATTLENELRSGIAAHPGSVLIANCDDVRITSIAFNAPSVVWVAAGVGSEGLVRGCPRCGSLIEVRTEQDRPGRAHPAWRCTSCSLARPEADWSVDHEDDGPVLRGPAGFREPLSIQLPGPANRGNAAHAVAAAAALGADPHAALRAAAAVTDIGQRYTRLRLGDTAVRLLLAKNPVATQESLSVIDPDTESVVLVMQAESDNARDTAWSWDVDYSALEEMRANVVASGDRAADISLRLAYDGVAHSVIPDVLVAVKSVSEGAVDVLVPGVGALGALERRLGQVERERPASGATGTRRRPARHLAGCRPVGTRSGASVVRIGLVLPEMLATSGDRGNALVLQQRLRLRGYDARIVPLGFDLSESEDLDLLDVLVLGGHESDQQTLAVSHLRRRSGLLQAIESGTPTLAVRAGAQILGTSFLDGHGQVHTGLGLLDATTVLRPVAGPAASSSVHAGEITCSPLLTGLESPLIGFDTSARELVLGPTAQPLARRSGTPADDVRHEGAVQGSLIATALQGPVLAWNPELADLLIARLLGTEPEGLEPLEMPAVDTLRNERLRAS